LIWFFVCVLCFYGCKPKYEEEIKPRENPALAFSKKANTWWQNQQNQPKPQRKGGNTIPPNSVTTFYPHWKDATVHKTNDNKTILIAPIYRSAKVRYYFDTDIMEL
jgi:hypothetical protein